MLIHLTIVILNSKPSEKWFSREHGAWWRMPLGGGVLWTIEVLSQFQSGIWFLSAKTCFGMYEYSNIV